MGVDASGVIYRIARKPDVWQPAEWRDALPDGTFGNRFDDTLSEYRVLYASSQRLGCFLETLARFRADLSLAAELAAIEGDDDYYPLGNVPPEWISARLIGSAVHAGSFADIYSAEWLGEMRRNLASLCVELGIPDLDLSAMHRTSPRKLTQAVSRMARERSFDGILYQSKFGRDIHNWALFEPFQLAHQDSGCFSCCDPELLAALTIHSLRLSS